MSTVGSPPSSSLPRTAPSVANPSTAPASPATASPAERLEFVGGGSNKFWQGQVVGSDVVVSWGKIGSSGQSQTKSFATPEAAAAELSKLVAEKLKKGYAAAGTPSAAGPAAVVDAFTAPAGPTGLRQSTIDRIRAALATPTAPPAVVTGAAGAAPPVAAPQAWGVLDDDGKAEALEGNRDVLGATLHEDVDLKTLTPAQRAIVEPLIARAASHLPDNDEGGENVVQIGDPEPRLSMMLDAAGGVLGVAVHFHQAGGAVPERDEDSDDDDDTTWHYPNAQAAERAGIDTGADVSWSTSEAVLFDKSGKTLREPGAYWEWTGW